MLNKKNLAVVAASLLASSAAFADEGTDAIQALASDAALYITAAFGVSVIIAGGFWGISMMKKAFTRAG